MLPQLGLCACIFHLVHSALSQGTVLLAFNRSTVYSGEPVKLTCSYGSGLTLIQVTVDAFNGTLKKGFLIYEAMRFNLTSTGVFAGKNIDGWPNIPFGATSVSLTLTATPSLELDYNCTAIVFDMNSNSINIVTSVTASLKVLVLPSLPTISPSITFNQTDNAAITCESHNGKPAANILLSVSLQNGTTTANNCIVSCSMSLPSPIMNWHNAMVTCRVTNHNFSILSVTKNITINYIRSVAVPDVVYAQGNYSKLNCSTYVRGYPGVLYSWSAPLGANMSVVSLSPNTDSSLLNVRRGQSGSFYCTARNNITMANVTIVFVVSNTPSSTRMPEFWEDAVKEKQFLIIGLVCGITVIVIATVVLCVKCKRRLFPNDRFDYRTEPLHSLSIQNTQENMPSYRVLNNK